MPYLNLDDNYPDHPKVAPLSDAAYRLHGSAMFYAARYKLDGYLTVQQLRDMRRWSKRTESELVTALLLHQPGDPCDSKYCPPIDGLRYRLHDFLEWNKPRVWWDDHREKAAERKAKWLEKQAAERRLERG